VRLRYIGAFAIMLAAYWPRVLRAQTSDVLRGTVSDSAGVLAEAAVGIMSLHLATRTDNQGRFTLGRMPAGEFQVSIRRIGYTPQTLTVRVGSFPLEPVRIVMIAQPEVLAGIASTEKHRRQTLEDFYWRRLHGVGAFFTREDILARGASYPSDVLRGTPGVNFVRVSRTGAIGIRFSTSSSMRGCVPQIWLDGQHAAGMELDDIPVNDIEGIELYSTSSTTPAQFWQGNQTSCGTIVVWSRNPG